MSLSSKELDEMYEQSKFDNSVFVGSEIRQLISMIRYYKQSYADVCKELDNVYERHEYD